jgi:hypothetical protein
MKNIFGPARLMLVVCMMKNTFASEHVTN